MAKKLYMTDQRMFQLMEWALREGIAQTETEYLEMINFQRTNIWRVKNGIASFTKEHIMNACNLTGASADYIFGFSPTMKRKAVKSSIENLKDAVHAIENDMKQISRKNKVRS